MRKRAEPWRVTLVETGDETMTGGRLKRVRDYIGDEPFCMTYGDGVADIDIDALTASTRRNGTLATITAVQPPGRFGVLDIDGDGRVNSFREKPQAEGGWINGGFMLLSPKVLDYIAGDATAIGKRADEQPRPRRTARGIPPRRLLAGDGHAARQATAGRSLVQRQGSVEDMVTVRSRAEKCASYCRQSRLCRAGRGAAPPQQVSTRRTDRL